MKKNSTEQENKLICIDEILNVRDYQREEQLLDAFSALEGLRSNGKIEVRRYDILLRTRTNEKT